MKCANGMSVEKGQAYASFVEEETSLVVVVIKSPNTFFNCRVSLIRRKRKQEARSKKQQEQENAAFEPLIVFPVLFLKGAGNATGNVVTAAPFD